MADHENSWRAAAGAAAVPWLATRATMLLAGYLAARFIGFDPLPVEYAAWRESADTLLNLPARWDAYWYLDIVRHGYQWQPGSPFQQNVVFFPLYPLLIRGAGWLLGGHPLLAGMIVSLAAFFLALVYFRRLAVDLVGPAAATRAVWLLAAYPCAVFFGAVYTESIFLLTLVAVFWHARRNEWIRAAAWGLLAGLARPNGCWLTLPLAWMALADARKTAGVSTGEERSRATSRRRVPWLGVAAATAPAVGMLVFSTYLWWHAGDPFAWIKGQAAWGSVFHPQTPPDPRWGPPYPFRPTDVLVQSMNVGALVLAACAVVPLWKRLGPPYALVVVTMIAPALFTHGVLSQGRFTSVLFPLFLWLAAGPVAARSARWIAASSALQIVAAALFFSWRMMI